MNIVYKHCFRVTLGIFIVLATLSGCSNVDLPPVYMEQKEWTSSSGVEGIQLLTRHYDIRMTIKDEIIRSYLPAFMETTFDEFRKLMPPPVETNDQLVIYLFNTRNEWAQFTRSFVPQQAYTYLHIQSGGYMDHPSATAVIHDIGKDRTLSLIAHEGFHQYLARYFPESVPAWLNEGLATQWEAFDMTGDRPIYIPHKNYIRTNNLREAFHSGFIPLPELLSMDAGHAVRETGRKVRTYYAQIWSLILYLRFGKKGIYADKLSSLLSDAGTNRQNVAIRAYRAVNPEADSISDGEALFRQYITDDFDTFMNNYRRFVKQLVF
ncbi:MAG: hypothetical protein ACYTF1_21100 [Planctomycetota bacterium]|jgi:hypothetical protein